MRRVLRAYCFLASAIEAQAEVLSSLWVRRGTGASGPGSSSREARTPAFVSNTFVSDRGLLRRSSSGSSRSAADVTRRASSGTASAMSSLADGAGKTFKIGLCQISSGEDKEANLINAQKAIAEAAAAGAAVVVLPECFNSPYDTACFPQYAEEIPMGPDSIISPTTNPSTHMLVKAAREGGVYLIGGSIPERGTDDGVYNTCVILDPQGNVLAKHRKMHLFDIDVPGKITFKESDSLSAGDAVTTISTPYGKIGVGICYDIRFPELSMLMRAAGAELLIFPGAFNMTTGPAHWELLQRARALDNQCFVATVSPARSPTATYQAWGHSTVVDPWGEVTATTDHTPGLVLADIDLNRVTEVRRNIPVGIQKRSDVYELKHLT